jgi:CHRD domain-containing protein
MRKVIFLTAVAVLAALGVVGASALANGNDDDFQARLTSYQELPLTLSTTGRGTFRAELENGALSYRLSYSGLEGGNALFAHIHLGQRAVAGGVIAFLCGGGGKPDCPATAGTVTGTIVAADVIGPAGQGIAAREFAELVRAMRAGAAYANVHTPTYPMGEIRGQIARG